jgi:hypothetical protein
MTQTIKNCNTIPTGTTYPSEHLRDAASIEQLCEYVDAGHPIAVARGYEVRLLRTMNKHSINYSYDCYNDGHWVHGLCLCYDLLDTIKLAPLAYKEGRPLHVGDEIIVIFASCEERVRVEIEGMYPLSWWFNLLTNSEWRFA